MKHVSLFLFLLISMYGMGQKIQAVEPAAYAKLNFKELHRVQMGLEKDIMLSQTSDVLIEFSMTDYPTKPVDSVQVAFGDDTLSFPALSAFLLKDVQKETEVSVSMFYKGKSVDFNASGAKSMDVRFKVQPEPMITNDAIVFGILAIVLGLIFYTAHSSRKGWKRFYSVIPALLLCYLIPALLDTLGLISDEYTSLYKMAITYLLPAALILMTIGIDFKGILNLGPKALIMFFTATVGIIIGGPLAVWVFSMIKPEVVGGAGNEAVWRGLSTLSGSWIGGGANQAAMLELYDYKRSLFGKMIAVDIVVAQLWMIFLLWAAGRAHVFDRWLKADTTAIDDLKARMENYETQNAKKPVLTDYMVILGLTFGLVGLAHWLSLYLAPFCEAQFGKDSAFASEFFWVVVISTIGALVYAATRARTYEGKGASKLGSVFIYILVATIGMKMDLAKILEEPWLMAVGFVWMLFHAGLLFLVAKLIKAPFFFLAVGSKANVGGAASAPVVAAAFHPSLASVGALLAVLGYAIGSVGAIVCAELMAAVAPI